jgi:hypothetical protein
MATHKSISTISLTLFISLALVPARGEACSGDESDLAAWSLFAPEVIERPQLEPLFYDPNNRLYLREVGPDTIGQANRAEWDAFFNHGLDSAAWTQLLERAPLAEVDHLLGVLMDSPGSTATAADRPFLAFGDRLTLISALFYVGFAKRVEPFATARGDWDRKSKPDLSTVGALTRGGEAALGRAKSPFLHQRYALQLLRLKFFTGDDAGTIAFQRAHARELGDGLSGCRAQAYVAGVLHRQKQYAESNLRFARIYDTCPALALQAFWSFHPQSEAEWAKALALAKTPHEKVVLWHLLGLYADGPRAMKEILALEPKSPLLLLLLVREATRAQLSPVDGPAGKAQAQTLMALVDAGSRRSDLDDNFVWDLVAAHLHALSGDGAGARPFIARAEQRAPKSPVVQQQLRSTRLFAAIQAMKTLGPSERQWLTPELGWLAGATDTHVKALRQIVRERLGKLLAGAGETDLATCLIDSEETFTDPARLAGFIAFLEKPAKTPFEAAVAQFYGGKSAGLRETQGALAFYAGDFARAAPLLAAATDALPADPFVLHIRDCIDCDQSKTPQPPYTKSKLAQRLATLKAQAEADPTHAAKAEMMIGTALYNVAVGNSRDLSATPDRHLYRSAVASDVHLAQASFEKAFAQATDRESKARAAYAAAKCELATYYRSRAYQEAKRPSDFIAGKWMVALRDAFSETAYAAEVIRECGYFRTFIGKTKPALLGPDGGPRTR